MSNQAISDAEISLCLYRGRMCTRPRDRRRDEQLYLFCREHRNRDNQHQREWTYPQRVASTRTSVAASMQISGVPIEDASTEDTTEMDRWQSLDDDQAKSRGGSYSAGPSPPVGNVDLSDLRNALQGCQTAGFTALLFDRAVSVVAAEALDEEVSEGQLIDQLHALFDSETIALGSLDGVALDEELVDQLQRAGPTEYRMLEFTADLDSD